MSSSDPIVFTGIDGRECERFIRSIKSHAFAQQKQRDHEWMADLAATLFDGAALRWYSQLDEDLQGNWKLLEKALLSQYPAEGQHSRETPPGSSTIPTPAAAAPSRSSYPVSTSLFERGVTGSQSPATVASPVNQGTIKVTLSSQDLGFISRRLDNAGHCQLTNVQPDAAIFEVKPAGKRSSLKAINLVASQPGYVVPTDDTDYLTFDASAKAEASGALWNLQDSGRLELVNFPMTTGQKGLGVFYGKPALSVEEQYNPTRNVIICVYSRMYKNSILDLTFSRSS